MSSEPPEEPLSRSEYNTLSPASPKPIHFPAPTNIPILDMQTDVGFNQTDAHPTTRNTETRPDMWQDPDEQPAASAVEATMDASPYSTGADTSAVGMEDAGAGETHPLPATAGDDAVEDITTSTTDAQDESNPNFTSNEAGQATTTEDPTTSTLHDAPAVSSDPNALVGDSHVATQSDAFSAQNDEVKLDAAVSRPGSGAVDIQGLLNTLQAAPAANGMNPSHDHKAHDIPPEHPNAPTAPGVQSGSSPLSASNLGVPPSGLPPRPPPQEQPLMNQNYSHTQHIRDYHPHATNSAYHPQGQPSNHGNAADPSSRNFVPPVGSNGENGIQPNGMSASAVHQQSPNATYGQPMASYNTSPPSAASNFTPNQGMFPFQYPLGGAGGASVAGSEASRHAGRRPEDRPWDAQVQRKYDHFLEEERRYVAEGRWEQFPQGSRLFVGNLSSEKVTKRDIFHVFHTYGDLAQISIKQAYGFVQFLREEDCLQALQAEEGTQIRDKKIHLEVSKPQKNRPGAQRRSRSPPDHRNRQGGNFDRFNGGRAGSNRRDDYRPGRRSPSPRGYRDRYDDRYRRRSPSLASYGGRARYRSPSPRRDDRDDLPLPHRQPQDVPDVQIIVLDRLDNQFIGWVEREISQNGVRVDVLLLSPKLNEQAVIRRQIVEGVTAVVKLTQQNQNASQIGLRIFDRSAGANNVRFEDYENLDPATAARLVLREKSKVPTPMSGYGQPGGGYQPPGPNRPQQPYDASNWRGPPPSERGGMPRPQSSSTGASSFPPPQGQGPVPPHLQSLITNLDPQNLQSLLSAMNTPQSGASANPGGAYGGTPAAQGLPPQQQQFPPPQQGYPSGPPHQMMQPQGAGQVNMQDILARLGNPGAGGRGGGGGR